jgi:hypothetical protein
VTDDPTTPVEGDPLRAVRWFEASNLIAAAALMAGAAALGHADLLPGALIGAAASAINVRATRRILERFVAAKNRRNGAAHALLSIKIVCVLACIGVVMYLRPDLGAGIALGFSAIVPASLVLAAGYTWWRLE